MTSLTHLNLGGGYELGLALCCHGLGKVPGYPKAQYAFDSGVVFDWLLWAHRSRLNVSQ